MSVQSEAEEIRRIAYELWQIDGEPFGRDQEHWERARRIFNSRAAASANVANGRVTDGQKSPPVPAVAEEAENGPAPDLLAPSRGRFATQGERI